MTTPTRSLHRRPVRASAAAVCTALVLLTGCGNQETPAQAAPLLARTLDAVDAAISAGDFAAARTALNRLRVAASRARDDGRIDPEQADAILQATAALLERLPSDEKPQHPPSPTTSAGGDQTTPSPEPTDEGDGDNGGDGGGGDHGDHGRHGGSGGHGGGSGEGD